MARRPTPLPPPPPRADPASPQTGPADDDALFAAVQPPRSSPLAGDDGDDGNDTAPLLSFEARGSGDSVSGDDGSAAGDPLPPDLGADDAAPLRARDVWAAARARRRALRAEVRRFTVRQRRRRMTWIGAGAAVVLLVLGSVGAAYSPLFAVETVRVIGAEQLAAATVEDALSGQLGRPLPLVDSSEVKAALVAFPLVESYTLEARPPHDLVVRIVERTPIGSVKSTAGYTLVDAAGVALATTPERPEDRPVLDVPGGVTSSAFAAIGTVYRSLPESIREGVTAISATTPHDVTLTLGETDTDIVWGDASQSAYKAVVLERIMRTQPPEDVTRYDVSSPSAVVVR